jgi:hypothetical protein
MLYPGARGAVHTNHSVSILITRRNRGKRSKCSDAHKREGGCAIPGRSASVPLCYGIERFSGACASEIGRGILGRLNDGFMGTSSSHRMSGFGRDARHAFRHYRRPKDRGRSKDVIAPRDKS